MTSVRSALESSGLQLDIGPFLVRLRSNLPEVAEHLEFLYPDFSRRASDVGHFDISILGAEGLRRYVRPQAQLIVNGAALYSPVAASLAGPLVEWGLNWCIARRTHRLFTLHAAVVERGGRVLILPAPPGAGKSTLCAALTFGGWRLFSDEFALVDPDSGELWPAPRPIALKDRSIEIIRTRQPDVLYTRERRDVEGARFVHARPPAATVARVKEPAAAGWVVLPRYVPRRATSLEAIPKAHALIEVAEQSFNHNYLGRKGYAALVNLIRQADCYRLEYSDLDDVLRCLSQMAER